MTDNREWGRIETNTGTAASLVADTALSRIDGALSDTLPKAVTSSNAVTITQNELRFVTAILFTDSGSSAAITATIDTDDDDQSPPVAKDVGGYDVINLTANAITIEVSGQSATAPVVAAGETARVNITATDVRGIGGAGGGGGGSITVTDEGGAALTTALASLDFVGSGVTATNTGDAVTVTIAGAGGGSVDAEEGGSAVVVGASAFNFAAADFDVTDEGSGVAGVALAGGGGGGGYTFRETITTTGGTSIVVDLSGAKSALLLMTVSQSSSGRPTWQLSSDGGSTGLTGYTNMFGIGSSTGVSTGQTNMVVGPANSTGEFIGQIELLGLDLAKKTTLRSSVALVGSTLVVNYGWHESDAVINAFILTASAGTFDVMNIDVFTQ